MNNNGEAIVFALIYIIISLGIAHFLGSKRKIGFGWSFFFCIFPNPLIGLIITMLSHRVFDDDSNNT